MDSKSARHGESDTNQLPSNIDYELSLIEHKYQSNLIFNLHTKLVPAKYNSKRIDRVESTKLQTTNFTQKLQANAQAAALLVTVANWLIWDQRVAARVQRAATEAVSGLVMGSV